MGRLIDLTGLQFNYLTVIERFYDINTPKITKWRCICKCGKECIVRGSNLKNGHTKSCGCIVEEVNKLNAKKKVENLKGKIFGKLTVLNRVENKNGNTCWKCKCECGKTIEVLSYNLKNGNTRSCGCLQRKQTSNVRKKDITMEKFGNLTALYPINNRSSDNKIIWHCLCNCGNYIDVSISSLTSGNTSSCGCIGQSKGENKISQLLNDYNICFEKQKHFSDCRFPDTKYYAYFDFYIPQFNVLIEYDGEQHFNYSNNKYTWNNEENFKKICEHDEYKNSWCKSNNIILIRIPYTHYKKLCIEDLLPHTSSFIFKGEGREYIDRLVFVGEE